MPEGVRPVFGLAVTDDAGRDLYRVPNLLHDIGMIFDRADAGREYEIFDPLRALQFPFAQCVHNHVANRDGPRAGGRLWIANLAVAVSPLANVDLTFR